MAHVFTMPSPSGVVGSFPLATSKALDVGMNMNNSDVSGRISIDLTFGVCTEVVQVLPIHVNQKNGQVFKHKSNTLFLRAHGGGRPQECFVQKTGGKYNLPTIASNAQLGQSRSKKHLKKDNVDATATTLVDYVARTYRNIFTRASPLPILTTSLGVPINCQN